MSLSLITEESSEARDVPTDELTRLELQIARRADELMRNQACEGTEDPWMQAEREVFSRTLAKAIPSAG